MCNSTAKKQRTISKQAGMSDFKYRMVLDYLEDEVTGVGSGTVSSIESHFESGDEFMDAAEVAYQNRDWDALTAVKGVGEGTAEKIALGLAEREGWEDGKAEMKFEL
jgi:Holliday junction resolvasome RuvABC DNA-binding subunit